MNKHFIMIDLETLGMYDDAVILSMGICHGVYLEEKGYDAYVATGSHYKFDIKSQINEYGRAHDADTVKWWREQKPEAQWILIPGKDDIKIDAIPDLLKDYAKNNGIDIMKADIYDRNSFDIKKLSHVIDVNLKKKVPWNYRNVVEIASFLKGLGFDRYAGVNHEDFPNAVIHNALHDAAIDAWRLENSLKQVM